MRMDGSSRVYNRIDLVVQCRRRFPPMLHGAAASATSNGATFFFNRRVIGGSFSSAAVEIPSSLKPHFMAEYLVRVCGFSSNEASKASQPLSHLKSTQKPDSVLSLVRSHGFDDALIRKIISSNRKFLCNDADNTLAPKLESLRGLGVSDPDLYRIISADPNVLKCCVLAPKIQFWREFLGSHDQFMRLFKYKSTILSTSLEKVILPNVSLLRDRGLPDSRIALLVQNNPWIITQKKEKLADALDRVEGLGIPCYSGMFVWALLALHFVSEAKFKARMQLMRSLGWSESEFLLAFRKAPFLIRFSDGMMRKKIEFFVNEAGRGPLELARNPVLLTLSVEKRLVPRCRVMQILELRGLHSGKYNMNTVMVLPDKVFVEKFVIPYMEKVPELEEMYDGKGGAP